MYLAVARKQGVPFDKVGGTIQNDILKEYIARGTYIYPPKPSLRLITDTFAFCAAEVPNWNTISISGYHIREAGSTAAQEIAFTLADGIAYVQAAIDVGLDVDKFAPRLSFFFNSHNNLLEEIAKFRAARRLWARIMRERFGAKDPRSMMLRFHTQTAGSTLTAQQPEVNVVRTTIQALAAVLGGTQSLHTNSMDEALGLPTGIGCTYRAPHAAGHRSRIWRCRHGRSVCRQLRDRRDDYSARRKARDYIEKIDAMGGMLAAIESGYVQREIQEAAYQYQRAVETKDAIVVGVNQFQIDEPDVIPILKIDERIEREQVERSGLSVAKRDTAKADAVGVGLASAATGTENLLPRILECVEAYVTVGEISNTLRSVWGEYQEAVTV